MIKAFFFDRDGVLIKNYGYVFEIHKLKFLKGAIQSITFLTKKKIKVFIVTNQSGVARGYYTIEDINKFHKHLKKMIIEKNGKITEIFYSPYHPDGIIKKFAKKSNLRKPGNGMFLKALKKYKLKASECFMIGDSITDKIASKKSRIKFSFKEKTSLYNQVKKIYDNFKI